MKTFILISSLLVPAALLPAADPAHKLAPRAIPGMKSPLPSRAAAARASSTRTAATTVPVAAEADRARVIYIHRAATLPPALAIDSPAPSGKSAPSAPVQIRQGAVKIIPKSEVAGLLPPQN